MDREQRKAAVDAYRKRKDAPGIYAIRSLSNGAVWLGQTPDLEDVEANLRAAGVHGEADLAFEVLERIEPPETAYLLRAILKDRLADWRTRLGGELV